MRLARPKEKHVYKHLDLADLEAKLGAVAGTCRRAMVVTDGVFSMRGDHGPLPELAAICRRWTERFEEDVVLVVDDSHGVGAFGRTGRGTEEVTGAEPVDILVATLGKAFGVNGGYVTGSRVLTSFLRETAATYIYSNPITVGECAAALKSVEIVDSPEGVSRLEHLRAMTGRFKQGLLRLGYETLPGEHPVVPLMVRDTPKTNALVAHLRQHGVLATGLKFPVVPRGDESIRFQISADHTPRDVDSVLAALEGFAGRA
jgi:glycine C-acetyltransferase